MRTGERRTRQNQHDNGNQAKKNGKDKTTDRVFLVYGLGIDTQLGFQAKLTKYCIVFEIELCILWLSRKK